MNDAETGDIYADANGKLWRVTLVVREPTITVEEVEGTLYDPNAPQLFLAQHPMQQGLVQSYVPRAGAEIRKLKKSYFTGSDVWSGWVRIWRKPDA